MARLAPGREAECKEYGWEAHRGARAPKLKPATVAEEEFVAASVLILKLFCNSSASLVPASEEKTQFFILDLAANFKPRCGSHAGHSTESLLRVS